MNELENNGRRSHLEDLDPDLSLEFNLCMILDEARATWAELDAEAKNACGTAATMERVRQMDRVRQARLAVDALEEAVYRWHRLDTCANHKAWPPTPQEIEACPVCPMIAGKLRPAKKPDWTSPHRAF